METLTAWKTYHIALKMKIIRCFAESVKFESKESKCLDIDLIKRKKLKKYLNTFEMQRMKRSLNEHNEISVLHSKCMNWSSV